MRETKFAGTFGHHLGKVTLISRTSLCKRNAGVIAALNQSAMQKVVDFDLAVNFGEHRRSTGRRTAPAPSVCANAILFIEFDLAASDSVEDDFGRHQFEHARRRAQFIGILFKQNATGLGVDQDRRRRVDVVAFFLLGTLHAVVGGIGCASQSDSKDQRARQYGDGISPVEPSKYPEFGRDGCHATIPDRGLVPVGIFANNVPGHLSPDATKSLKKAENPCPHRE